MKRLESLSSAKPFFDQILEDEEEKITLDYENDTRESVHMFEDDDLKMEAHDDIELDDKKQNANIFSFGHKQKVDKFSIFGKKVDSRDVSVSGKAKDEFMNIAVCQELSEHSGAIWALKFSKDGKYLASGGQDCKLIIWRVRGVYDDLNDPLGSIENVNEINESFVPGEDSGEYQLIESNPIRVFQAHTNDIVDISWSKDNFILSASVDKTVKLWHITSDDCLQSFSHPDIVTAVDFHPFKERHFVTGCFDKIIRVWDVIPEARIKEWVKVPDIVTAVAYSPDGQIVVAGMNHGQLYFYKNENLKYYTQLHCASSKDEGKKVTGIVFLTDHRKNTVTQTKIQLLITTNDSRMRVYNLSNFSLICKYKGLKNKSRQIKGTVNSTGTCLISGSDDGQIGIWKIKSDNEKKKKKTSIFEKQIESQYCDAILSNSFLFGNVIINAIFAPPSSIYYSENGTTSHQSKTVILCTTFEGKIAVLLNLTPTG